MPSETPKLQPIVSQFSVQILQDGQLSDLKQATLQLLEEVGVHCPSRRALEIYAAHGGRVDLEKGIVRLPAETVLKYLSYAPRSYMMGARLPEFDLKIDGSASYCATDGCGVETVDFKTGQRRQSCKQDVANMARVADYLPSMGFYWPIVSAQDHPATAPLHELEAALSNTVKHVQTPTVVTEADARAAVEMAKVVAGDVSTMRERPPLSFLICTIAPLAQDKESMEAALVLAEAGLPVGFMSMALAGSTAPATIAGTMLVGDAEVVSALVLIQMAYPGAPVYYSLMPGIMHPRTGGFLGNTLGGDLFYSGGVQLAHMWGVPALAGVGAEADKSGWDSALGIASSMLLCVLSGAETMSGLGLREGCTLLTPEALVLDNEIYNVVRLEAAGIKVSPETLALDVIKAVGPKGHYLNLPHTRQYLRKLEFSEVILSSLDYKVDAIQFAKEKTDWILENHFPQPLDEVQQAELKRIIRAAEQG
jgi:trimethylamine--corrinoid protein Co-methyltransferase